jgi:hypothetical protein
LNFNLSGKIYTVRIEFIFFLYQIKTEKAARAVGRKNFERRSVLKLCTFSSINSRLLTIFVFGGSCGIGFANQLTLKRELEPMSRKILENEKVLDFVSRDAVNWALTRLCSVYKFVGLLI